MKRFLTIINILFLLASCEKIARGKKFFSDKEYYTDGQPGAGLIFLRQLKGEKMYGYDTNKSFHVVYPDSFRKSKLAWGTFYFMGMKKKSTKPDIFYIILSYDSTESRIIFDKNGNADFTDDSLMKIEAGKKFTTSINNLNDPEGRIEFNMVLKQDAADSSHEWLFKALGSKTGDGISSRLIVSDKNRYFRKIHLPDSNVITLYDRDVNGFFNDHYDMIIAGDIQKNNKILYNSSQAKYVRYGIELPFQKNTYRLIEVDKYGNNVELDALDKISDTSETLPAFRFINEKNQTVRFNSAFSKKYTVLYVWGSWCIGCVIQGPAFLKLMKRDTLNVGYFTFNCGEKPQKMNKYLEKSKCPFKAWRIDDKTVEKLHVDGFPHYIVVDQRKRIVFRTLEVGELGDFLTSH